MPYIPETNRDNLEQRYESPGHPGELNFVISRLLDEYVKTKGVSYSTYNEIVGVLECAKLEFYRRLVVGYEEQKLNENGDVYTLVK